MSHVSLRVSLGLALALFAAGCGGPLEYQVASSQQAPGADAKIVADVREDQHQTALDITIENLPPAERVAEGSTTYVAWYRKDDDAPWVRLASLAYDEDDRTAKLQATAPEVSFELVVSAERSADAASVSPAVVLSQKVN